MASVWGELKRRNVVKVAVAYAMVALLSTLCLAPAALSQERYLNLTWVDRSGAAIEVIGEPGQYRGLDASPDGRLVAVHQHSGSGGDIWLFDGEGEATRFVADATGVQDNAHPIFSPDGRRIVYSSLRDGTWGLYVRAVDGRGDEELVHTLGRTMVPMSWSPDGRFIVYWENTGNEWVLPLDGDRTPFRLMDGPSSHSQISPDGNWVAYLASGDVWVRAFPEGPEAWQVSANRGLFPRWRGDGRELYYTSAVSLGMIMAVQISPGGDSIEVSEPSALFDTEYLNLNHPSNYHTFAVSQDGERFLIPRPEPDTLVVVDSERGTSTALNSDLYSSPKVSPDASQIAVIRGNRSVWVVDVAGGDRRQIGAVDDPQAFALSLAWSPDGDKIAYLALNLATGNDSLYLADVNGAGDPEPFATLSGIAGELIGFTPDGDSLIYFSSQLGGDAFFRITLDGEDGLVEMARTMTGMRGPRLSPDGGLLAYHTNALNSNEVWIRSIDLATGELGEPVRVDSGLGLTAWRADGSELYYVGPEREFMAVTVQSGRTLTIGEPRRLFDLPDGIPPAANFDIVGSVSLDGSQAVFAVPPRIPPQAMIELRVVDRTGRVIATPGEPALYQGRPIISPDGMKVAAGIANRGANTSELWLFDLEADTERLLVSDRNLNSWIWSDDGDEIIYEVMDFQDPDGGAIYRASAVDSRSPEPLYRHYAGTGFNLIDWSADGRFVLFVSGGVLYVLPLDGDREPVELIREEYSVGQALLSPDNRFVLFSSDETETNEAWLWPFDPDAVAVGPESEKQRLSTDGSTGPHSFGRSGSEVTYRHNGGIVTVEFTTSLEFSAEAPRELFRHPEGAGNASASRNGERWVFHTPAVDSR